MKTLKLQIIAYLLVWLPFSPVFAVIKVGSTHNSQVTSSSNSTSTAVVETGLAPSKFKTCPDLLRKVQDGELEKYFVDSTASELDALKLLNDYGAIVGPEVEKALIATMLETGMGTKAAKSSYGIYRGAMRTAKARKKEWIKFTKLYFENLKKVVAASPLGDDYQRRVIHLQLTRLADSVLNSDKLPMFAEIIRKAAILYTLKNADERIETKTPRPTPNRTSPMAIGMALGGIYGAYEYCVHLAPSEPTLLGFLGFPLSMGVGSAIGAAATVPDLFMCEAFRRNIAKRQEDLDSTQVGQLIKAENSSDLEKSLRHQNEIRALTLSSGENTWRNLDRLSPMQIAYVGQVDLLKAQADAAAIEATLSAFDTEGDYLLELEKTAKAVQASPSSYQASVRFLQALQSYTDLVIGQKLNINDLIASFEARVEKLKQDFAALRKAPFQLPAKGSESDIVDKGELLYTVIQAELATIEKAKFERQALEANMAVVGSRTKDLRLILEQRASIDSPEKVLTVAEDTLLLIDGMRAMQAEKGGSAHTNGGNQ